MRVAGDAGPQQVDAGPVQHTASGGHGVIGGDHSAGYEGTDDEQAELEQIGTDRLGLMRRGGKEVRRVPLIDDRRVADLSHRVTVHQKHIRSRPQAVQDVTGGDITENNALIVQKRHEISQPQTQPPALRAARERQADGP